MYENVYQDLLQRIDETSLVLTVNQRLAAYLQEIDAKFQMERGLQVWSGERILPISAWRDNLWLQLSLTASELPLVLNVEQELFIWQQVIAKSDAEGLLLSTKAAAKQAQKAWRLLQEWNLTITDINDNNSDDVMAFRTWANLFQAYCQKNHWICESEQVLELNACLQNGLLNTLPKSIYLLGFIELSPQWQSVFDTCKAQGITVEHWQIPTRSANTRVLACQDSDAEYRAALHWAYQSVQANPQQKIALIMPQLQNERLRIERLANEFFTSPDRAKVQYAISGGTPLFQQPIVYDAWLILQLHGLNDYEQISRIIRSPFIAGSEDDHATRDSLDYYLRKAGLQHINLATCLKLPSIPDQCPALRQRLQDYQNYHLPKSASVASWSRHYLNLLNIMGWPGQRELNSQEYQAVSSFYQCLEQLETHSLLAEQFSGLDMFQLLTEKLRATIFQAQSPLQPQVQIIGILESAGLIFDQIWVCGLHEQEWPASARPNPLLPISLQRSKNMPHASAERELKFAKTLLAEWQKQCQNLALSYPSWQDDIHLSASPLLRDYPVTTISEKPWRYACQQSRANLEVIADHIAPPLTVTELASIEGGYSIFKQQALCPFQAYTSKRLRVSGFPEFTEYLDNRIRGTLLHGILERIWREIKTHARLVEMTEAERADLVSRIVATQLRYWHHRYPELLTRALAVLEQQRLDKLLTDWLAIEAERPPFTVAGVEETFVSELAGIPLQMRIDRIDELADGSKVILDYKTGLVNCNDWFSERPNDPQLPIYALLTKAQAIVYAQLRSGKLGFYGVAEAPNYLPNVQAIADSKLSSVNDWDAQLASWQQVLDKLADEFKHGEASVSPKSIAEACQRCDLQSLCRINDSVIALND